MISIKTHLPADKVRRWSTTASAAHGFPAYYLIIYQGYLITGDKDLSL